jgi:hypothetical protein
LFSTLREDWKRNSVRGRAIGLLILSVVVFAFWALILPVRFSGEPSSFHAESTWSLNVDLTLRNHGFRDAAGHCTLLARNSSEVLGESLVESRGRLAPRSSQQIGVSVHIDEGPAAAVTKVEVTDCGQDELVDVPSASQASAL